MINIKVAVRIRPFSKRELAQKDDIVIRKEDKSVLITYPKICGKQDGNSRKRARRFIADFCYDPKDPEHSSQEIVYQEIGLEVLDSMFGGYNACVLAYGHSASGKTYTMMGTPRNPGLTPRLCEGLFNRMNLKSRIKFQVAVSFLEIYNEKVKDLLTEDEGGPNSSNFPLRVREHPRLGPYVQDLSQHLVTDKNRLLELLDIGNKRRSTAATKNNMHSSRSHSVFTLQFKQTDYKNYETNKSSKVHLVDLAGSERASDMQTKTRLKEGSNINKSLVALGNVISALAENYESKAPSREHSNLKTCQPFVPYRDSVLTWLLKDTLGGNSNTIMIATVSPASSCFNETVNTLRYAKRTKRIMNQRIINEDPKTKTIRELREEIIRLRSMLYSKNEKEFKKTENFQRLLLERKTERGEALPAPLDKTIDYPTLKIVEVGATQSATYRPFGEKSTFSHMFVETQDSAPLKNDACKINDEKKSGANGSVIDDVHETEIFSDDLESSSPQANNNKTTGKNNLEKTISIFSSAYNLKERKHRQVFEENELKVYADSKNKYKVRLKREPSSCENLTKINENKSLYKKRPDLVKSNITHLKNRIFSNSYRSCTDISNIDKSDSENSLNSLGSLDNLLSKNTHLQNTPRKKISHFCQFNNKKSHFYMDSKKKDKRSEIVKAVTTRLHVSKNKMNTPKNVKQPEKKEGWDDYNEFKELKLCKRARTKLCALSRELELASNLKKTSDINTQTDFNPRTYEAEEKNNVTDLRETLKIENLKVKSKDSATVSHFFPQPNKYLVHCGMSGAVRTKFSNKHDMQVSDAETMNILTNLPVEFMAKDEDCFSEDSLDKEEPTKLSRGDYINTTFYSEKHEKLKLLFPSEEASSKPCDSLITFEYKKITTKNRNHSLEKEKNCNNITYELESYPTQKRSKEIQVTLFNGFSSSFFPNIDDLSDLHDAIVRPSELKKKDNLLSTISRTSAQSTKAIPSNETSFEDLLFNKNETNKEAINGKREEDERILYTIAKNSENTNSKDKFNSVQNQKLYYNLIAKGGELQLSAQCLNFNENDKGRVGKNLHNYYCEEDNDVFQEYEAFLKDKRSYVKETQLEDNKKQINVKDETKNSSLMNDINASNIGHDPQKSKTSTAGNSKAKNFGAKTPLHVQISNLRCLPVCNSTKYSFEKIHDPCRTSSFVRTDVKSIIRQSDSIQDIKNNIARAEVRYFEPRKINWADLPANNEKQFVNFNILKASKKPQFSIDTHLFREVTKKDQSTETVFGSKDSITFVFMGPAKPKTSVLMEVIKRSLNEGSSNEITFPHKKSRSTGVQCKSKFLRSVSVDTAFTALSRIAQEQHISRTISLDNLTTDKMVLILEPEKSFFTKENSCQCNLDENCSKVEIKQSPLRYSVSTSTSQDQQTETLNRMPMQNKNSKNSNGYILSMSQTNLRHDGISISDSEENDVKSLRNEVQQTLKDSFSPYMSSGSQTRRVRFLKPETSNLAESIFQSIDKKKETAHLNTINKSSDAISLFLREATILLKNLNHFNTSPHESIECHEQRQDYSTKRKDFVASLKRWTNQIKRPSFKEEAYKRIRNSWANKCVVGRSKSEKTNERALQSLIWPTRQHTTTKSPRRTECGTNLKSLRSPMSVFYDSLISNGSLDVAKKHSSSDRRELINTAWNSSNPSTARINSCNEGNQKRAPNSRSNYPNEYELPRGIFFCSNKLTPRTVSATDLHEIDSILDLETQLEESCYRLKLAAERDQVRQQVSEGKHDKHKTMSCNFLYSLSTDHRKSERTAENRKSESTMKLLKRRTSTECIRKCVCKDREKHFCAYPRSKTFRSTFELATFGPGSNHCHQFCTFCRQNESELYCSAPTLNSECTAERCRLNYYGHCPCSSVKLRHVISSPRAYMQHLLTLRRQVVNSRKINMT